MPPAALISSTAIFMPLETGTPHTLIGPDRSWCVPITISVGEMPSLVTLVCASAGRAVSASALTARPSAFNDFDISFSSPLAIMDSEGQADLSLAVFRKNATSGHRAVIVHGLDLAGVALVHKIPLQFHGRRQLFILRRELTLDQIESLD